MLSDQSGLCSSPSNPINPLRGRGLFCAADIAEKFASFTNAPNAVSVSSCTAGMHLIYFALGYGSGDEVIVPAQTHTATSHAVEYTGAKAIFVDVDQVTGNILPEEVSKNINAKTKAVVCVHMTGIPCQMDEILKNNTAITADRIEDVPGTHIINYSSSVDEIEIKHTAKNRDGFAMGAIIAAEWIIGKEGIFNMQDVLAQ